MCTWVYLLELYPRAVACACVQENPELDAIWRLLQYFWNKHYQGIWQALQGYQWSQQVGIEPGSVLTHNFAHDMYLSVRQWSDHACRSQRFSRPADTVAVDTVTAKQWHGHTSSSGTAVPG
jgi:hypothetical protein